jgi:hypothetical protein
MERHREILGTLIAGSNLRANLVPDRISARFQSSTVCSLARLMVTLPGFPAYFGRIF